jgi:pilus assembly protein Flp/PilA
VKLEVFKILSSFYIIISSKYRTKNQGGLKMGILKKLVKEEEGQALTEYGLIIGLIAVVCIAAITLLGGKVRDLFTKVANNLTTT